MKIALNAHMDVAACHSNSEDIAQAYPNCLILTVPDSTPMNIGHPWTITLEAAKLATCDAIDAEAERRRNSVLTPGSGQMAAYQAKEIQARALLADDTPTEAEYPDIYNEIGLTAGSAGEVAMAVLTAAEKWRSFGRLIERARLAGKKAVAEAGNVTAVIAARDGVSWP